MSATSIETPPTTAAASEGRRVNKWLILVIACLAQFMVVLDITVVNIALPSIQTGLNFSSANLQWVVNGYTLIFGGFLLLGGRAADLMGRKRLFVAGVILFSAASLLNGLAQSSGILIAGRMLQGLGGALVSPAALAIITTTFTDTERADQGTRDLVGDRRLGLSRRTAAGRRPDRRRVVAVGVLHQRPDRARHDRPGRALHRRVAGGGRATLV